MNNKPIIGMMIAVTLGLLPHASAADTASSIQKTNSLQGVVTHVSPVPDPKTNPYKDCLITVKVQILPGVKDGPGY